MNIKVMLAIARDPDIFIELWDKNAGANSYTMQKTENFSVSAGQNEITHTFGKQPKIISVRINDNIRHVTNNYPIQGMWWVDLSDSPTSKIFARFDSDYSDVDITFYY